MSAVSLGRARNALLNKCIDQSKGEFAPNGHFCLTCAMFVCCPAAAAALTAESGQALTSKQANKQAGWGKELGGPTRDGE